MCESASVKWGSPGKSDPSGQPPQVLPCDLSTMGGMSRVVEEGPSQLFSSTGGSRGLVQGRLWRRDGVLAVSCAQEGVIRVTPSVSKSKL